MEQLEAARTERTKVLLWCSPSNPTGAVAGRELTEAVGGWAAEHDVWVITDEIYEHLIYDGAEAVSMPVAVPELADRCVVLNGVAKTYAMTGWRVGWLIGPADVVKAATNLQSHLSSNVCNVAQRAALEAVTGTLDAVAEMRTAFDRRRRAIVELPPRSPVCSARPRGGRSTPTRRCSALLGKQLRGARPRPRSELAATVLEHAEVAVVPGEAFGTPGYFRLSYALGRRRPAHRRAAHGRPAGGSALTPASAHRARTRLLDRTCRGRTRAPRQRDLRGGPAEHGPAVELAVIATRATRAPRVRRPRGDLSGELDTRPRRRRAPRPGG